jgi:hypothetical protein
VHGQQTEALVDELGLTHDAIQVPVLRSEVEKGGEPGALSAMQSTASSVASRVNMRSSVPDTQVVPARRSSWRLHAKCCGVAS